jgi:hypothetical protein
MSEELFDPAELRAWERDPRGQRYWEGLREMGNIRMSGVRKELEIGNTNKAIHLAGGLEAVDEARQLVDIIIEEHKKDQEEKESQ